MNLSRRALLSSIGFGVMSACAGAQTPPAAKPVEAPEDIGARKQRLAAPNPMGVTQASFRRAFEAGMKPAAFPAMVQQKVGVSRVSWCASLLGAASSEALAPVRAASDDVGLKSVLLDPEVGPGLASPDAGARKAAMERLKPWIEGARKLSCIGVSLDLRGEGDYDAQLPLAVAGVRECMPLLNDAGLQGVVKCLGGLTSNGQFLAALMNQLQDAMIRLEPTFDSWRVSENEEYHRNRGLELVMPYAACVLADYTAFKPDGESTRFPTSYCVQRVREGGFRGPVMMQFKGDGDELAGVLQIKKLLSRFPIRP